MRRVLLGAAGLAMAACLMTGGGVAGAGVPHSGSVWSYRQMSVCQTQTFGTTTFTTDHGNSGTYSVTGGDGTLKTLNETWTGDGTFTGTKVQGKQEFDGEFTTNGVRPTSYHAVIKKGVRSGC